MVQMARRIEAIFPQLRDDLTNCLLLFHQRGEEESSGPISEGRFSEGLIAAQFRKTAGELSALHPEEVVSLKGALRHLRLFLPLLLSFSLILIFDPSWLGRSVALMMHPLSNLPLKEISIALDPKGSTVLRGTEVTIEARTAGSLPKRVMLAVSPEGQGTTNLPMESEGNGKFTYRMASARSSFRYQAFSGRSTSPSYEIRVVDPPEIAKNSAHPDSARLCGAPRGKKGRGPDRSLEGIGCQPGGGGDQRGEGGQDHAGSGKRASPQGRRRSPSSTDRKSSDPLSRDLLHQGKGRSRF